MTAGLLLVAPLHVGGTANRFAIRNLGSFESHIHAISFLQSADGDLHVLLAGAGNEKFLGLRIAIEAQRKILFQNLVQRIAHAIFIVAALCFNCKGDGRLGYLRREES